MPVLGGDVDTPDGRGRVMDHNVIKETVIVELRDGRTGDTPPARSSARSCAGAASWPAAKCIGGCSEARDQAKDFDMPIFEYRCKDCKNDFEALVAASAAAQPRPCPECGGSNTSKLLSMFAASVPAGAPASAPAGAAPGGGSGGLLRRRVRLPLTPAPRPVVAAHQGEPAHLECVRLAAAFGSRSPPRRLAGAPRP